MESRKQKEQNFHNMWRDEDLKSQKEFEYLNTNKKWYSIVQRSRVFVEKWLNEASTNKKVLDYCCGNGSVTHMLAKTGAAKVVGIDISDISIENAKRTAIEKGINVHVDFVVMDAEKTTFEDNSFDVINESGVLHHLDLAKSYAELARILKPDGKMICTEGLGHNPIIHYYRKKTPHLRTKWEVEHIMRKKDIEMAKNYFGKVDIIGFFHLATIAAVPFRNTPVFNNVLNALEAVDDILLKLPGIKWLAWQAVFVLSDPLKKEANPHG